MKYSLKEYTCVFDTPLKKRIEEIIVEKIMSLLNNNVYNSIEDFYGSNNQYDSFAKNNNMANVLAHFKREMNDSDYVEIINNLKKLENTKQSFDANGIRTTWVGDKEIASYTSSETNEVKTPYYFDNTGSTLSIDEQLHSMQPTSTTFQTSDPKENTQNMFKEMNESKKISINFIPIKEIIDKLDTLSFEDREKIMNIVDAEQDIENIRVDLANNLFITQDGIPKSIESLNGDFVSLGGNENSKSYQKVINNGLPKLIEDEK